jgi:hypothetical protein
VCAGVRAREPPEETVQRRPGFWFVQGTSLSPSRIFAGLFKKLIYYLMSKNHEGTSGFVGSC